MGSVILSVILHRSTEPLSAVNTMEFGNDSLQKAIFWEHQMINFLNMVSRTGESEQVSKWVASNCRVVPLLLQPPLLKKSAQRLSSSFLAAKLVHPRAISLFFLFVRHTKHQQNTCMFLYYLDVCATIKKKNTIWDKSNFQLSRWLWRGWRSPDYLRPRDSLNLRVQVVHYAYVVFLQLKGIDHLWSCDCIVKETLWNRSEKIDHLA